MYPECVTHFLILTHSVTTRWNHPDPHNYIKNKSIFFTLQRHNTIQSELNNNDKKLRNGMRVVALLDLSWLWFGLTVSLAGCRSPSVDCISMDCVTTWLGNPGGVYNMNRLQWIEKQNEKQSERTKWSENKNKSKWENLEKQIILIKSEKENNPRSRKN